MRILVCGGRDYTHKPVLFSTLDGICKELELYHDGDASGEPNWLPNVVIISGKAPGADSLAIDWAVVNFCAFIEFPASWELHGKSAGPIRNQQMIDEGRPDLVIAFPGGRGTADMIRRAQKSGIPVRIIK